jgi:E3 ubiquitin-protein ligase RNF14
VVFQCASFIQTEAWDFLEFVNAVDLVMQADGSDDEHGFSVQEVRAMLKEHNGREKNRIFKSSMQTCGICMEDKTGDKFEQVFPCNHFYCSQCLGEHCKLHIAEGSVQNLQCPTPKCPNALDPMLIKRLVDEDAYARYDRLTLQKALEGMSDVVICPIKTCQASVIEDSKDCFALCPECKHSFCTLCLAPYHPGTQCMSPEQKIALMKAKMQNNKAGAKALEEIKRLTQEAEDVQFVVFCALPACSLSRSFVFSTIISSFPHLLLHIGMVLSRSFMLSTIAFPFLPSCSQQSFLPTPFKFLHVLNNRLSFPSSAFSTIVSFSPTFIIE